MLYLALLYSLLLFKGIPLLQAENELQLTPLRLTDHAPVNTELFHSIKLYAALLRNNPPAHSALFNLCGNVLIFVPFGLFLPCLLKNKPRYLRTFLAGFCVILSVELMQLISGFGIWDIDDILLNLLGLLLGLILARLVAILGRKQISNHGT